MKNFISFSSVFFFSPYLTKPPVQFDPLLLSSPPRALSEKHSLLFELVGSEPEVCNQRRGGGKAHATRAGVNHRDLVRPPANIIK